MTQPELFSEETYSASTFIRHEYVAAIYSRTINGVTTYNYTTPRSEGPHIVYVPNAVPVGTRYVAYVHTHPTVDSFSQDDVESAVALGGDGYVVGPSKGLIRFNLADYNNQTSLGVISPIPLRDTQRASLIREFEVSWDFHISTGCKMGCDSSMWPGP